MSDQVCRFCQRYVQLTYYCDECGANCCSDCLHEKKVDYYLCQECNSKNIGPPDSDKNKVCNDCGNDNIIKINQPLKSCPKCGSHKIINIYEKKEDLEKEFLELIKNSRLFINPLREVLDKLFILQQEIKKARDPPIRCYHFPKMESDLLALFKLFVYVQNTLFDKINAHFHQMVLYKEYFFDIYSQPNSNITIIEGIFDNLLRSHNSINDFVFNNVKTFKDSIASFEANLKFVEKISLYFSTYKKLIKLAEKEKPVYAIYAKLVNGLNTDDRFKKDRGILFITNLDLSFIHEFGLRKKKRALIFKAPVRDLIRIKEKGKVFKKLYLEFEYGKYEFTLPNNALSRVIEYILLARTFDESTVYDSKSATKLQRVEIDLNELANFIEESINSFFSLKCQYNKSSQKISRYNQIFPQFYNGQTNQIPISMHQSRNQEFPYQSENLGQLEMNQAFIQNPNNQYLPFYIRGVGQSPQGLYNYISSLNHYQQSNPAQSRFFPQNFINPNRFQNYNPQKIKSNFEELLDIEENDILTRNLEQTQAFNPQYRNQIEPEILNDRNSFQEFNKNHLSDLFNINNSLTQQSYKHKRKLFKLDREKHEKMLELEKERYSLKATLKKLETKFDQGSISESDYFRTYRNLNKEIYLIDNKIQKLRQSLEELESLKQNSRNFDNKRFYT
ncbi:MAG: B-box zinc finger protein [Candidatus Hodarchaeota archaeon]